MGKLRYEQIQEDFERAVIKMQEDLQFLADNDKVSEAFISKQNAIIKALIDYQHLTEGLVSGSPNIKVPGIFTFCRLNYFQKLFAVI